LTLKRFEMEMTFLRVLGGLVENRDNAG